MQGKFRLHAGEIRTTCRGNSHSLRSVVGYVAQLLDFPALGLRLEQLQQLLRLHAEDPEWKLEACLKGTTDMFMRDDIRLRRVIARTLESWGEAHSIRMFPEQTACAPAAASAMLSQKGKGKS